ncbi:hypothetical protein FH972_019670 [Carpinus fangiana]|uniref:Uncharacterized protein n=1 Tax=Carpinus fangiana TaxID=176857 RepID=A0A5N6RRE9_9ROSI|nr:hypothetical protein FH972_019670 [Carpinus fangiana]
MPARSEAKEVVWQGCEAFGGGEAAGMGIGRRWSQCIVFEVKEKKTGERTEGKAVERKMTEAMPPHHV